MPILDETRSNRRCASWRSKADEGGRLRTHSQAFALVPTQAAGESDGKANCKIVGTVEVQLAIGASSLAARRLSAVLGVRRPNLGWKIPRPVPITRKGHNDAKPTRIDEEGRLHATQPSTADSQLVSGEKGAFLRRSRGFQ